MADRESVQSFHHKGNVIPVMELSVSLGEPLGGELPAGVLVDIQECVAAERCSSPSWSPPEQ